MWEWCKFSHLTLSKKGNKYISQNDRHIFRLFFSLVCWEPRRRKWSMALMHFSVVLSFYIHYNHMGWYQNRVGNRCFSHKDLKLQFLKWPVDANCKKLTLKSPNFEFTYSPESLIHLGDIMSHVCLINRHLSLSVSCSSFLTVPSQLHQSGFIYSMNKDGSGKPKSWLQIVHSEIVGRNHRHYIHVFLLSLIKTTNLLVKRNWKNFKYKVLHGAECTQFIHIMRWSFGCTFVSLHGNI